MKLGTELDGNTIKFCKYLKTKSPCQQISYCIHNNKM